MVMTSLTWNCVNAAITAAPPASARQRWLLTTIIACTAVLPATFLWAPALSMELADKLQLGATQIGMVFSVELVFSSLATVPAFFWLKSRQWQRWGLGFMAALVLGNALSAWLLAPHFTAFLVMRGVTALANGSLMILCTRSVARLPDRGRGFGALLFGQLLLGTLGIAVLPFLFRHFGTGVCFSLQALLILACMPLYRNFIQRDDACTQQAHPADAPAAPLNRYGLLAVIAVFAHYLCLGGIWTFIGAVQEPTGMSRALMEQLLVVSSAVGMLGAATATVLGNERWRKPCLLLGFAAQLAALVVLTSVARPGAAWGSALVLQFTWTLLMPFLFTVVSLHDDARGRLINLTNMVLGLGLGIGPALCGWLLETFDYQVMFGFGAAVSLCAAVTISVSNARLRGEGGWMGLV